MDPRLHSMARSPSFLVGVVIAFSLVLLIALYEGNETLKSQRSNRGDRLAPVIDLQAKGPLLGGVKVSLGTAKIETPHRIPLPSTDIQTGALSGIWMDEETDQVAFVWDKDLRFYSWPLGDDETEEALLETWTEKAAIGEGKLIPKVLGHTAIGQDDGTGGNPSSLTFVDKGLILQFVSPGHTLDELTGLAERLSFE